MLGLQLRPVAHYTRVFTRIKFAASLAAVAGVTRTSSNLPEMGGLAEKRVTTILLLIF
jgi:hypothetical protein